MRAHQIMTRNVITVLPSASILDAADIMLKNHISGLPVVNKEGELVGIISEGDFLRRSEIGTQRKKSRLLRFFISPGESAVEFVRERGRKVEDVMTSDPVVVDEETTLEKLVHLMEKKGVKRLPVMQGKKLVGIVSRANVLRAVASLAKDVPDPTADDDHIRERIIRALESNDWCPTALQVTVRDGVVQLHGVIMDERDRQASIVAAENVEGVKQVHDHLCFVDAYMGSFYLESPEDRKAAS